MTDAAMNGQAVLSAEFDSTLRLGEIFTRSGYFRGITDEAQAIVKILYGQELGFSPVASMMGIHIVEGKPELGANMLASLVKQSARYDYRVTVHTDEECAIEFFEESESIGTSTFSIRDARRAGIAKAGSGWEKYPRAMLFARALSSGVRTYCPDVAAGPPVYVQGEIGGKDPDPAEPAPAQEATVTVTRSGARPEAIAEEPETISTALQRAIHREFRQALDPGLHQLAGNCLDQLLTERGHLKADQRGRKRPSTAAIPVAEYEAFLSALRERADELNRTGRAA